MKIDTTGLTSFIPEAEIFQTLENTKNPTTKRVREIIAKSLDKNRLAPEEMAVLLNTEDPELLEEIFEGARELKRRIYGNRIVLFAPLYIGNNCINNCKYCGFRCSNKEVSRKTLTMPELDQEIEALVDRGHKRLILVYGEHPKYDAQFIHDTVVETYSIKKGNGEIRRVNINAAPLDVEGYKLVKSAGIGTYQIFQETYHQETYKSVHPSGPKSDYLWRLYGLDRAQDAGIDDVGLGALMGLFDWKFEAMGLLYHTIHLEEKYNVGPHTLSFPRIEPAIGTDTQQFPGVNDADFKKLVAILRLAVPYTGLILTCRESVEIRNEVIEFGVSQIDAGSDIGVGAYSTQGSESYEKSQFVLNDGRPLDLVLRELSEAGFLPSFCTGCYRLGRTGEHFMEFAVPGFVKRFCTPNAVLTFLEYIEDYASEETKEAGMKQVERELERMPDGDQKKQLIERIEQVKNGQRDLYF
ncbi:[FeFe] hydrogenase H-cluster radical SAM maturase HydG [Tichowtungia aerotolerans]|uniref:[FeFe] hydrogenase H-cluster radical SAM maturase HydG n=1 Tax=Tichowtungia aerotolerans TaxID=2697043 RepID=A0A6P1ME57_9BACT|nr:[FeFe] hydrogenase H-cluster radical SAM maturase HydG [Tichowtungia aerotolerans]QHI69886.1 [FeFe] hydrogenase H-cluster radical SAM maturase HydG [Tichowtungia aerotolerans]